MVYVLSQFLSTILLLLLRREWRDRGKAVIFFTRNKTSNLNRDYIEEDTFQVISSWKERKITSSNLFKNWNRVSKNSGGRKESGRKSVRRARRQWPEEHRVPRSRTFRHEIMGGFCSTSAEKKKNRGKWLCGTREKGNVQGAAFDKPYLLEGNTVGKIVA